MYDIRNNWNTGNLVRHPILEKEKLDQESDDHTINDNDGGTTTHATNACRRVK
jgi:hypothetical protein